MPAGGSCNAEILLKLLSGSGWENVSVNFNRLNLLTDFYWIKFEIGRHSGFASVTRMKNLCLSRRKGKIWREKSFRFVPRALPRLPSGTPFYTVSHIHTHTHTARSHWLPAPFLSTTCFSPFPKSNISKISINLYRVPVLKGRISKNLNFPEENPLHKYCHSIPFASFAPSLCYCSFVLHCLYCKIPQFENI